MTKGKVPSGLGRAVYVTDESGKQVFSHLDIPEATEEEIEAVRAFTREKIKDINHYPGAHTGGVSLAKMRASYASQMVELIEANLRIAEVQGDTENIPPLHEAHAKHLRDCGRTREALALYPENEMLQRAVRALDKPDSDYCDCPRPAREIDGVTTYSDKYEIKAVFYADKGGDTWLYRCRICKDDNVSSIAPTDV